MLKWTVQSISLQLGRWAVNKNWNGAKVTGVWRKPREAGQQDARCCQNNGKETGPARHNLKHQQRMLSSEQRKRWAVVQGHLSGGLERRRKIGKWTTGRDTQGVWYPHHSEWICCLKSITAGRLTPGSVINVTSWALFSQRHSAFTAHLWAGMGSQARFKEVCKN